MTALPQRLQDHVEALQSQGHGNRSGHTRDCLECNLLMDLKETIAELERFNATKNVVQALLENVDVETEKPKQLDDPLWRPGIKGVRCSGIFRDCEEPLLRYLALTDEDGET